MMVLCVADTHGTMAPSDRRWLNQIKNEYPIELIVCLGDIYTRDFTIINSVFPNVRKVGVLGNHDSFEALIDNNKELLDWFVLCQKLGVKRLALDVDIAWYREIENKVPDYVKDLIIFAKNMAKINSVQLDLYDRADMIYKSIKIDHKH